MKRWLSTIALTIICAAAWAQITITADDMPVHGDTLRYTNASPFPPSVGAADSGEHMTWSYGFTPTSQGLDEYKRPSEINPLYAFTLPSNPYGYKIADSIPGLSLLVTSVTITDLYTFFNKYSTPPAFAAEAFGATISGFPAGASYIDPDVLYFFPLTYGNNDSANFYLKFGLPTVGGLKEKGYRKSRVDGWGTITTPYYTSPTACIRVRSEIHEIDSVTFDSVSFGLPRVTVEYKYLVKGQHYPAVWATANVVAGLEVVTSIKYKDIYRAELNPAPPPNTVKNTATQQNEVTAYPNPAIDGKTTLKLPEDWKQFSIEVFDAQSKPVATFNNKAELYLSNLPSGNYVARVISGTNIAFVKIVR